MKKVLLLVLFIAVVVATGALMEIHPITDDFGDNTGMSQLFVADTGFSEYGEGCVVVISPDSEISPVNIILNNSIISGNVVIKIKDKHGTVHPVTSINTMQLGIAIGVVVDKSTIDILKQNGRITISVLIGAKRKIYTMDCAGFSEKFEEIKLK